MVVSVALESGNLQLGQPIEEVVFAKHSRASTDLRKRGGNGGHPQVVSLSPADAAERGVGTELAVGKRSSVKLRFWPRPILSSFITQ